MLEFRQLCKEDKDYAILISFSLISYHFSFICGQNLSTNGGECVGKQLLKFAVKKFVYCKVLLSVVDMWRNFALLDYFYEICLYLIVVGGASYLS